jgi:hypothetical protein
MISSTRLDRDSARCLAPVSSGVTKGALGSGRSVRVSACGGMSKYANVSVDSMGSSSSVVLFWELVRLVSIKHAHSVMMYFVTARVELGLGL